jgi:hypothetical protein
MLLSLEVEQCTCLSGNVIILMPMLCPCNACNAMHLGSEIYQETLVKALARHFGARLLVVDSLLLPGVSSSYVTGTYYFTSQR